MPIVHVRANAPETTEDALAAIAETVADAMECPAGDVWCTYQRVDPVTIGTRPANVVYVDLLARPRDGDALQNGLAAAARATSTSFGVPLEDVWAHLTVLEPGTVFAGRGLI